MDKIAETISLKLSENNCIQKEDVSVCKYGLELFLMLVLEVGAILLTSVFVGNFLETVIFFIAFLPLRMYVGGYHADTRIRCFGILVFVYILFSILILFDINTYLMLLVSLISVICIYIWAPLQHKNKSIQQNKQRRYKRISVIISVIEALVILLANIFNIHNNIVTSFFLGFLTVLISLCAGKIKKFIGRRRNI